MIRKLHYISANVMGSHFSGILNVLCRQNLQTSQTAATYE